MTTQTVSIGCGRYDSTLFAATMRRRQFGVADTMSLPELPET